MKRLDWLAVTILSLIASWFYFWGTSFILGMDYFTHLAQADIVKRGIKEGIPIPAYHFFNGGGSTFIRYQGMLVAQLMGWWSYIFQGIFAWDDTQTIIYSGRVFCVLLNIGAGCTFLYAVKQILAVYDSESKLQHSLIGVTAATAYIFGWPRLAVVMHIGSLQRAGALVFYPICFSLVATIIKRPLNKKEQWIFGLALAGLLLSHPANFLYLFAISIIFTVVFLGFFGWQDIVEKGKTFVLPTLLFFLISAWFLVPFIFEKEHYGLHKSTVIKKKGNTPWTAFVPPKHAYEFISRDIWFGNSSADPDKGGSYLGGFGGTNSAYFGVVVVLLSMFGCLLARQDKELFRLYGCFLTTALIVFVIIFWKGLRYNLLYKLGSNFVLPFRWLGPLYFLFCFLSMCGICSFYLLLKKYSNKIVYGSIIALALFICIDSFSLPLFSNSAKMYTPQNGKQDAIAINMNHGFIDSYDIIKNYPRPGKVLDVPYYLLACNTLYHKRLGAVSEEQSTDWPQGRDYDDRIFSKDIVQSIDFSLDFSNRHPVYSLKLEDSKFSSNLFTYNSDKQQLKMKDNWSGTTTIEFTFVPPIGKYKAWITFPIFFPGNSRVKAKLTNSDLSFTAQKQSQGNNFFILPFENNSLKKTTYKLVLTLSKEQNSEPFIIYKSFVAYDGLSLAYRLALLDIRFIVVNRLHHQSKTDIYADSKYIRKMYQSRTSVLYENLLSRPCFFPDKVYLITRERPWELFNAEISHHPNYNPNNVSFCFTGEKANFAGEISENQWQQQIVPLFIQSKKNAGASKIVRVDVEEIELEVINSRAGFVFFAFRYHPNLRVSSGNKDLKTYQGQANTIAVELPAGKHDIVIRYHHPWYDIISKYISLLTVITLLGYGILLVYKKYNGKKN